MLQPGGPHVVGCRDFAWQLPDNKDGGITGSNVSCVGAWLAARTARRGLPRSRTATVCFGPALLWTNPLFNPLFNATLQHVVGRLFYPAPPDAAAAKWPAATWIKSLTYAKGA